jgi:hypothetical protein
MCFRSKLFANSLVAYLNHQSPQLRVEALRAFFRIKGVEGNSLYHDLVDDPDIDVQKEKILQAKSSQLRVNLPPPKQLKLRGALDLS